MISTACAMFLIELLLQKLNIENFKELVIIKGKNHNFIQNGIITRIIHR